jgi:hypothetical protein
MNKVYVFKKYDENHPTQKTQVIEVLPITGLQRAISDDEMMIIADASTVVRMCQVFGWWYEKVIQDNA